MARARTHPRERPSPSPAPTEAGPGVVVPLYNEHDLARSLLPWADLARRQQKVKAWLVLTDLCVLALCFVAGRLPAWLRDEISLSQAMNVWWAANGHLRLTLFAAVALTMVSWMWTVQGHYSAHRRKPWWDETRQLIQVIVLAALLDAMVIYLAKWPLSRLWTGATWGLVLVLLPLSRLAVRHWLLRAGLLTQPYVLIGHPDDVEKAAAALASEPLLGYKPVAVVCPAPGARLVQLGGGQVAAPTALTPGVRQYLAQPSPYQLVGVLGIRDNGWLRELAQELMLTRDDLVMVPALGGLPIYGMEVSHFFSHDVLLLRARNNLNRRGPQVLKRALDIVGATTLLVLLAPLFAWVAWRIKRDDAGPAFFVQKRVGVDGQLFDFIKFRSMVMDADGALERWKTENQKLYVQYLASNFKLANDPRITKIGRLIRRTSIDELPQLINVLRGDMSLVGPRPLLARELGEYGKSIAAYGKARPGITGLWQISGRSTSTFQHRINMDLWYVRNWSLWYDLVIMLRTVRVVLRQEGAC
ncbi:MAG: undecaprenyl-phosphate galactose phosphotransferase WbaP [Hydrogenophaga sp.]|uniref:undecaprenyl-phosphate galactose phosphotransferase WbaP n=1 Tax=Hydrogenophaga sp. TaxID=1904254 RepID=UPI0025C608B3|nr:undecaprenyl-phosphate galactose phosphotransferase WbaP [Hydrogenophaga sp.]MBU7576207.1 undecaprenyl-phosphate galactose phosphotransferase WbaP [Hydrogenophaga sp.]